MRDEISAAELAECIAPLNEEGRRAVRRYWDRVIREEMRAAAGSGAVSA